MTIDAGKTFLLDVQLRDDGERVMLAFPHREISNIIENAAIQAVQGRDEQGIPVTSAFKCSGFEMARGPNGEAIVSLYVGKGGKIGFVLPGTMPGELRDSLMAQRLPAAGLRVPVGLR